MGRMSRNKGASFEREVANMLSVATGVDFSRNLNETREGNDGDVVNRVGFPLAVQAKCRARVDVFGAVREAVEAGNVGDFAVAVLKRTNGRGRPSDHITAMPTAHFLELLRRLTAARGPILRNVEGR